MVSRLPDDMNRAFLPYLTKKDLLNLSRTSKDSQQLIAGDPRVKAIDTVNKILESLKKEETQLNTGILAAFSGILSRINYSEDSPHIGRDVIKSFGVSIGLIAYSIIFGEKSVVERYSRLDKVEKRIANWNEIKNKL